MKILAPVNSFSMAELQITSGTDEIYFGFDDEIFKSYSFTGRGKCSAQCGRVMPDFEEAKRICSLAKEHQVKINLTANIPILSEGLSDMKLHELYSDYVLKCLELGADAIIAGDLSAILLIRALNSEIPIHASTFFDTINSAQLEFLHKLGVERAILSYHVANTEILSLLSERLMEIEVIGYMGCSFFNGSCNLVHEMGEVNQGEAVLTGIPCKAVYSVSDGQMTRQLPILDFELGCGLCSIQGLNRAGVDVFKIAGRERREEITGQVVKLVRRLIDKADNLSELEFSAAVQQELPTWWRRLWCHNTRCKFICRNDNLSRFYIGV